jgi:carboxyl-terminal processing protease
MSEFSRKIGWIGAGVAVGAALSVTFTAYALREPTLPVPVEDLKMFSEVYSRIKSEYVEPVQDKRLIKEAINGMVQGLDPHSTFLDADALKEFRTSTEGKFGGVGIEIGTEDGFIRVVAPIDDTPAHRAGIRAGDLITKVNGESTKGMGQDKAVSKMRGNPGTKVSLEIFRKSEGESMTFHLTREEIKIQSVRAKMLDGGIGYVRITSFQHPTMALFNSEVKKLYKNGDLKGMVLDLRYDPGGLLNASVGISSAFLPRDTLVVYTDGRSTDSKVRYSARREDYCPGMCVDDPLRGLPAGLRDVPLVVLVNYGSASASEIVAGALKDHKRATIIGTTTFGKGSVQTLLPLSNNHALKLTTQRYYTPNGVSIQAKGIVPDYLVDQMTFDGVMEIKVSREVDLVRRLGARGEERRDTDTVPDETREESKPDEPNAKRPRITPENYEIGVAAKDFQLTQALNFLNGRPVLRSTTPIPAQQTAASDRTGDPKSSMKPRVAARSDADKPASGAATAK